MTKTTKGAAVRTAATDLLFDAAGSFLFALGTQCFSAPNQIAPGGVSGAAILINHLTGLPISMLVLAMNVPLLVLAMLFLGRRFSLRTIKSVLVLTFMLQITDGIAYYEGETILAALFGGVLAGAGLGLVFMRSSTTGGTDIVARLIQRVMPTVSVGKLLLAVDGCVLLAAALVYKNIENALYALVSIFAATRLIDSILYGLDMGKVLMIVTQRHQETADRISERIGRGCTFLEGKGAYTGQGRPVLLCAVRKSQVYEVKKVVFDTDPAAFIMAVEANEIIGTGFKEARL